MHEQEDSSHTSDDRRQHLSDGPGAALGERQVAHGRADDVTSG